MDSLWTAHAHAGVSLLRELVDAQMPPDGPPQVRVFDFCGRFTKLALSRDVFALAGAQGPVPIRRCLDAGIVRLAGLQVVCPSRSAAACPPTCTRCCGADSGRQHVTIRRDRVRSP